MSFVENKEVVRILVKKCNGQMQPECKNLCVDPQLTSFEILQRLLVQAFNIKTDFAIYYLATDNNTGQKVYLSLLSDWDLDAAFGASNPILSLKVDLKPFEGDGLDDEWDVVGPYEVGRNTTEGSTISTSLRSFINRKVSGVIQAIGLRQDEVKDYRPQKLPMSDAEFHNFLDAVGHLVQPQQFRLSVYQGGVEPSLRRVVWRHLLNVYPDELTGRERFDYLAKKAKEYLELRNDWLGKDTENIQYIGNMVRKDVLRTDRQHLFFAGTDESENLVALFNLLVTYALTHPAVGYCQGMSDLASPILVIEKDEAHAYICFCALMKRLETNFSADGLLMTSKFEHLSLLLQHYDPVFADYLKQENTDLFFCYRWILLEMKREFPLDDALYMLEVMWSTLPLDPPEKELALADPVYFERGVTAISPSLAHYIQLRAKRKASFTQSLTKENVINVGSSLTQSVPSGCVLGHDASGSTSPKQADCGEFQEKSDRHQSHPVQAISQTNQSCNMTSSSKTKTDHVQRLKDFNKNPKPNGSKENSKSPAIDVNASLEQVLHLSEDPEHSLSDRASKQRTKRPQDIGANEDTLDLQEVDLSSCEEADERTNLLDPAFVNVSDMEKLVQLPPPTDFGCGNPFLMFLCLSLLLQHRDHVISNRMDCNEIAVFFDRMVRKHDVHAIVHHAKYRYALYLRQQQQVMAENADSDLSV